MRTLQQVEQAIEMLGEEVWPLDDEDIGESPDQWETVERNCSCGKSITEAASSKRVCLMGVYLIQWECSCHSTNYTETP